MKHCIICDYYSSDDSRYCNTCGHELIDKTPKISDYDLIKSPPNKVYTKYASQMDTQSGDLPNEYIRQQMARYQKYIKDFKRNLLLITLLFGWLGGHKFYTESPVMGALYLFTCWTQIPFWLSMLEFIRYACLTPEELYETTSR